MSPPTSVIQDQERPFLLETAKLRPPFARAGLVCRTELLERLLANAPPVVAVVAPAGYGKSTLLRQFADQRPRTTAWLTLDRDDNDPVVLLNYIAAALDSVTPIDPELFRVLAVEHVDIRSSARALGSTLAAWGSPGALVMDDVHELENPDCFDIIEVLVDHVPPGSQVLLASRAGLPLRTARLRAEGRIVEITPQDLALETGEAASLLQGVGVELELPAISALVAATEGWPVAVYLAGRSSRVRRDGQLVDFSQLGRSRDVVAYAHAELLGALPNATVQFLTRASVLDRMSGPLCDAVLDTSGSSALLEELAQSSLLVMSMDDERNWYRYHHLLRDLLREELDRSEPWLLAELCRRAAAWWERNGVPDTALDYAMQADDLDRAAQILSNEWVPVYRTGRVVTLTRWFDWFDRHDHLHRYPGVAMGAAWVAALTGRPAAAERWAEATEHPLSSTQTDNDALDAQLSLLRGFICRNGMEAALADVDDALQRLPLEAPLRAAALAIAGIIRMMLGSEEDADATLIEAAQVGREMNAPSATTVALGERALIALHRGDKDLARDLSAQACDEVVDSHLESLPTNAFVFAVAARLAVLAGDVDGAEQALVRAQRLRSQLTYAIPHLAVQTRLELVRTLLSLSDVAGARTVMREIDDILRIRPKLGKLVEDVESQRAVANSVPVRTVGASSLTAAELRLLPLLNTHLTFRAIGERLFVSHNTVKTQAISIYRKLGVSSRSEAMSVARQIGLIFDQSG